MTGEDRIARWHLQLGEVVTLMLQVPGYHRYPLAAVGSWIQPAIFHQQVKVFRDDRGVPIGYLTWAFLTRDVAARVQKDRTHNLHFSEWNEGEEIWIVDFLALPGWAPCIFKQIRAEVFANEASIRWLRTTGKSNVSKTYCYNLRSGSRCSNHT